MRALLFVCSMGMLAATGCAWTGDATDQWALDTADLGDGTRSVTFTIYSRSTDHAELVLHDASVCPLNDSAVACNHTDADGIARLSGFAAPAQDAARIIKDGSIPTLIAFHTDDRVTGAYDVPTLSLIDSYLSAAHQVTMPDKGLLAVAAMRRSQPATGVRISLVGAASNAVYADEDGTPNLSLSQVTRDANVYFANVDPGVATVQVEGGSCRSLHTWDSPTATSFFAPIAAATLTIIAVECD